MRLGLNVGYWGLGLTPEQQLDLVQEAEAAGFHSVWAAEAYGSDAGNRAGLARGPDGEDQDRLGDLPDAGRSPAMTAMTAATLDNSPNGRMTLGIGSSGPAGGRGLARSAVPQAAPADREYVAIVRKALARERLEFEGENYRCRCPTGPARR